MSFPVDVWGLLAVGGRSRSDKDASLLSDLDAWVEHATRGDPMSPLL